MKLTTLWVLGLALLGAAAPARAIEHRLGLGIHAWRSAGALWNDPTSERESDLSGLLSYQLVLFRPLKLQADLEFFPNGFEGSGEEAWSPQGLIVVGNRLYAALGIGTVYSRDLEGNFSDPIYIARLGIDLPVFSRLHLDLCADERAGDMDELARADEDTITFAMVLRARL
jgi:hypothetical protein